VNVPRHLPFKIGKIKEAACGGTGNLVLTGVFTFTLVLFSAKPCTRWIVTLWSELLVHWEQGSTVCYEESWETEKPVI